MLLRYTIVEMRLIKHGYNNAYMNMAIDEALLIEGKPTLRLYKWKPSAISIGYFQSMEEEVNIDECKKNGVDFVRRITGGGAVYHDMHGEITYSIILPSKLFPSIMESYKAICSSLANGLKKLGIDARHAGINDIVVNGKKISGSAQTRRYGKILQHGTILVKADVKKMFSLLKVSKEKISDKDIKSIEERVTSIENEIGSIDENEIMEALVNGFKESMKLNFFDGDIKEKEIAEKLVGKYESKKWNFKR